MKKLKKLFAAVSTTSFIVACPISGLPLRALLTEENEMPHSRATSFNVTVDIPIDYSKQRKYIKKEMQCEFVTLSEN